jgi:uncharacterized membrane protein
MRAMDKSRLEAFSDAVIAILMTIMVLELRAPHGHDWSALRPVLPSLLVYVLSFAYLGIYWNNHHHFLHVASRINGRVLWANLLLLFWLSLVPFTTAWVGESEFAQTPTAVYGVVLLAAAIAYYIVQTTIVRAQGPGSTLARALGNDVKGKLSPVLYLCAIGLSLVSEWIAIGLYAFVAAMWLVPDPRIEGALDT